MTRKFVAARQFSIGRRVSPTPAGSLPRSEAWHTVLIVQSRGDLRPVPRPDHDVAHPLGAGFGEAHGAAGDVDALPGGRLR